MKVMELVNCSFSTWYPLFKTITIPSQIIPLPQNFVDYLNCDIMAIPGEDNPTSQGKLVDAYDLEGDDDEVNWDEEEGDGQGVEAPTFPEFEEKIRAAISKLGGKVFPKLNWSAPQDASWVSMGQTLECSRPYDIFLLLKSSVFVSHDLNQALQDCDDWKEGQTPVTWELVLRRWTELDPGLEFRCFVKNSRLLGICQRHHESQLTDYVKKHEDEICSDIVDFFSAKVENKFPGQSYAFDIYRGGKNDVTLIDFNPFGHPTDPLLFSWNELNTLAASEQKPRLRYGEAGVGIQPHPGSQHGVPQDFLHLASGEDPLKLLDLLHLKIQKPGEEVSSDDDSDEGETAAS